MDANASNFLKGLALGAVAGVVFLFVANQKVSCDVLWTGVPNATLAVILAFIAGTVCGAGTPKEHRLIVGYGIFGGASVIACIPLIVDSILEIC